MIPPLFTRADRAHINAGLWSMVRTEDIAPARAEWERMERRIVELEAEVGRLKALVPETPRVECGDTPARAAPDRRTDRERLGYEPFGGGNAPAPETAP